MDPLSHGSKSEFGGPLEALAQGGKSWKLKHFVIRDNFLMYFREPNSSRPEGVIPLEGAKICVSADFPLCFEVTTGSRRYHLRTADEDGLQLWLNKVTEASLLTIDSLYETKELLGQGTFSKVKRAVERSTGLEFAIKVIDKTGLAENRESILTEIGILKHVRHPNILRLHQIFEDKKKIYLVTELLEGGELFDRIVERGCFSEQDAARIIRDIVDALAYLHGKGICHRDLKPENILLDKPGDDAVIKITDFGLSKFVDLANHKMLQTACGTPGYVAPEVLEQRGYEMSVDMWSTGVILYILLCGFPPFYAETDVELYEQIKRCDYSFPSPYWDGISENAKLLIRGLLRHDPASRLTPQQVLEHEWLVSQNLPTHHLENVAANMTKHQVVRKRFKQTVVKLMAARRFSALGSAHHAAAVAHESASSEQQ